ncbi:glycosyl transferase [Podospora conica]|nr:glycosyl transferase [Schizothecium conicum]
MATQSSTTSAQELPLVDIKPLLSRLWPLGHADPVTADEIAQAIAYFFTNQVSDVQASSLLIALHFTGLDRHADVLAKTAAAMLKAAAKIDVEELRNAISSSPRQEGAYQGGLVDIVGTGGDSHNTFNISTTASIICSSSLLIAKHGNKASTSKSGSADLLAHSALPIPPQIDRVRPSTLAPLYRSTNYAFLYAPVFHPGMRHVAPLRRQLPWRTIFNLVGPLANPADALLEARMIGTARKDLGPVFAEALRLAGATKALVVCGDEELDEVSCAGDTLCWRVTGDGVEHFRLHPRDFALPAHPLSDVSPGKEPAENAAILARILRGEMPEDDPILHFVLMNAAALFVTSGICEAETEETVAERGPGGGRWKEGVRRARWAITSGEALRQWERFVEATNGFSE